MKRKESRDHQDKEAVHHLSYLLLFVQRLSDFCYSKLGDFNAFEKSQVITSMGNAIESLLRKVDAIINESSNFSSTLKGHGTRISNLEQSIERRLMDNVFPDSISLNSSSHYLSPAEAKRTLQMLENQDAKTANHEVPEVPEILLFRNWKNMLIKNSSRVLMGCSYGRLMTSHGEETRQ